MRRVGKQGSPRPDRVVFVYEAGRYVVGRGMTDQAVRSSFLIFSSD
jgi:hypothetical protein